ncbi:MAG TPA: hypothetical protein VK957_09210 [Lunatimonas sp.]|nr:hypothetical protein [Lunatimonas sp.]
MKKHIFLFVILPLVFSSCDTEEPIPTYTLSTSISPIEGGKIAISPQSPNYKEGEVVTLTPEPNEHWVFQNWEGDASGSTTPLQITMNFNKSVTGAFIKRNYQLTITIEGEGIVEESIITNPSGREYPHGTTVELTPVPKEDWIFESWGGDLTGSEAPKTITVDKEMNVIAKFVSLPTYPTGSEFGPSGPTIVIDVTNPSTGKTWMDRNLGATQAATSSTDENSYGDLFQWGRRADGHQLRTSSTTSTLSSTDQPSNGDFILIQNAPCDWRIPENTNLWQGVDGVNNPCPSGYRLPTNTELNEERLSWGNDNNATGAFASPLKLPMAGGRNVGSGSLSTVGTFGHYWSSTVSSTKSLILGIASNNAGMGTYLRASGASVRCLKD